MKQEMMGRSRQITMPVPQNLVSCFSRSHEICCHQMSHFNAKMHRIQFWLGSAPDPAGGAYNTPQTP